MFGDSIERLEQRTFYSGSLRVKLTVFGMPKVAEMTVALNEPNLFAPCSIPTLPPSIHHKWKEKIYIVCKITNRITEDHLSMKNSIKLKVFTIVWH